MGIFDRFENAVEKGVNNAFSRVFKSGLKPVDINTAIRRAMDDNVRELSAEQYVDILVSGGRPLINVDTLPAPAQELSGSECKILPLN